MYMPCYQLEADLIYLDSRMLVSVAVLAVLGRLVHVPDIHVEGFLLCHWEIPKIIATDLDRSISRDCIPLQWQATRRTGFVAVRLPGRPPATNSFNDDFGKTSAGLFNKPCMKIGG
jgi:hypothetical protein